ncbi:type II CAAX endopeptidase family protein [Pseudonocardia sp. NPDC046786]|uniref:CPBP family intramembrane glutamic endopeptidase n=1 Tax=Pseudonocardia sp. NPDC046786 TaxID=3155471 RepID=UPI0033F30B42
MVATVGTLLIWLGVTQLSTALWGPEMSLPKHVTNAVGTFALAVPLVLAMCRYLDRRAISSLGLTGGKQAFRDVLYGALTWLIPAAIGMTAGLSFGWLEVRIESSVAEIVGAVLLLVVLVFTYEAFSEELIFRGYIYRNLTTVATPWIAVVVQALLFSTFGTALWVINNGWGVLFERSILFFGMAIVAGCVRLIAGSIWASIGFHLAFQVIMQLFLGSHYANIHVSNESIFILTTAVVAFCAATTIAGMLWREAPNWTKPDSALAETRPRRTTS